MARLCDAEGAGFEPADPVKDQTLSRRLESATLPPLRKSSVRRAPKTLRYYNGLAVLSSTKDKDTGDARHASQPPTRFPLIEYCTSFTDGNCLAVLSIGSITREAFPGVFSR